MKAYLKPRDIPKREAVKILMRLNACDSAEQLGKVFQEHTKQMILTVGDTQKIFHSRVKLGKFQELRQVSTVKNIGAKKFDFIVRALSIR